VSATADKLAQQTPTPAVLPAEEAEEVAAVLAVLALRESFAGVADGPTTTRASTTRRWARWFHPTTPHIAKPLGWSSSAQRHRA